MFRAVALSSLLVLATAHPPAAMAQAVPPAPAAVAAASDVAPDETPAPTAAASTAPLGLAKTKLQLNPGGVSTVPIVGGVPPYGVAFGTPNPVPALPAASPSGPPAASSAVTAPGSAATPPLATAAASSAALPAASAVSDLATLTIDPAAPALVVNAAPAPGHGARPPAGTAVFTVTDATGAAVTGSLLVGPNAGFFAANVPLTLVGSPSADFTSVQIAAAIRRSAGLLPDARLVLGQPQGVPSALPEGQTLAIPVKAHVDGAGKYVDVDGIATVNVTATAPERVRAATLFYSDDPENVKSDGILFRGTVAPGKPARLYYYHQALTPGHQIAIVLDTPSGAARVTVIGQGAGPNPAVFFVGQNATYRYLDDANRGAGVALDVPVGAPVVIGAGDGPLAVRDLVAGIFDVAVTDGDPVRLTVLSYGPGVDPRGLLGGDELPTDGYRRRGEFDLAQTSPIVLTESLPENFRLPAEASPVPATPAPAGVTPGYTPPPLPEPTAIVAGGGTTLPNLRPGGRALGGDYGLVHDVTLTMGNDTDVPRPLYFYEQPITGYPVTTTIAFAGDPAPVKLQCVKTRTNRYLIRAFTVRPHATVVATGSYMTDGGSTYPLAFGLTATPPSPLPVTMTEADGCFPKPGGTPVSAPIPSLSPSAAPMPNAGT